MELALESALELALVSVLVLGMTVVEGLVLGKELAASLLEGAAELTDDSIAVLIWAGPSHWVDVVAGK